MTMLERLPAGWLLPLDLMAEPAARAAWEELVAQSYKLQQARPACAARFAGSRTDPAPAAL